MPGSDPPPRPAYDPYAAPVAVHEPLEGSGRGPARGVTWAYGVTVAAALSLSLVETLAARGRWPLPWFIEVLRSADGVADVVLPAAWLYASWKAIPDSRRGTISPSRAAFSLFIPVYGLYWGLAVNLALCETLDAVLVSSRSTHRSPRTLAVLAYAFFLASAVVTLVATFAIARARSSATPSSTMEVLRWVVFVVSHVGGALWFFYAFLSDETQAAVARIVTSGQPLPPPELTRLQRKRGPRALPTVAFWMLIFVGFLGCWQILQPGERRRPSPTAPPP